jgi:predicted DNA-binding protein
MNSEQRLLNPVPVRFPETMDLELRTLAKTFGIPVAELIRRAVEAKLPEWEAAGQIVIKRSSQKQKTA